MDLDDEDWCGEDDIKAQMDSAILDSGATIRKDPARRMLCLGSSFFTTSLAASIQLPDEGVLLALVYQHYFFASFPNLNVSRRMVSAACVLLSTKIIEATSTPIHDGKLIELTRTLHRMECDGSSATAWIEKCPDEPHAVRDRIRDCEQLLLRILKFDVGEFASVFACLRYVCVRVLSLSNSLLECIDHLGDMLYEIALGSCFDLLLFPIALEYNVDEIAAAAVWKAGVALDLRFFTSLGCDMRMDWLDTVMPNIKKGRVLRLSADLRKIYNWIQDFASE